MSGKLDHLDSPPTEISTTSDDASLPNTTDESRSHLFDSVDTNILIAEKAFLEVNNQVVDVLNVSSSAHCGHPVGQSVSSYLMPSDAVYTIKDEIEQSDSEAGRYDDDVADNDVTQHIDSVFFACDLSGTGAVAVSDVITYLSETLCVSNCYVCKKKNVQSA